MKTLNENKSLLIIIDVQEKLLNAVFNKEILKNKAIIMAKAASSLNIPILVTEQYPKGLGSTIKDLKESFLNNVQYYEKNSFSALDNSNIRNSIRDYNKRQIVIFGIETHICVSQTAIALVDEKYDVTLIKDASGSRDETEHNSGIERMKEFGIHTATTEIALFEWLKNSKHEKFKEIQTLIK